MEKIPHVQPCFLRFMYFFGLLPYKIFFSENAFRDAKRRRPTQICEGIRLILEKVSTFSLLIGYVVY